MSETQIKDVYTIIEQGDEEKGRWVRIGVGFVNRDDSINILLDALPMNGRLNVRNRVRKKEGDS